MAFVTTDRLILRPPLAEDFDAYADYVADPAGMAFLGGAQSRAVAWRSFMTYVGAWAATGVSMFFVFEQGADGTEGRFLGRVGPWAPEGWPGTEVGWGLSADAQGRGYALEAAEASMHYAVEELGWEDIIHSIDPANAPSIKLAERLGSARLGECDLPDPINKRIDCYGQSAAQWRARRG
jgi:RimJ/RimL family protein N-acetyltransferase